MLAFVGVVAALSVGCGDGGSHREVAPAAYDPDWDPDSIAVEAKTDGVFDILPVLSFDTSVAGEVGEARSELYVMDLRRTDRVELTMEVTGGDLDPHLSFFFGSHTYISSESWNRDGASLRKVYRADQAGRYLVAARAYRARGAGSYRLTARCVGGPCAGELPPAENSLSLAQAISCISQARQCAFVDLDGVAALDEDTARQRFNQCLAQVSLDDGSSCATACDWMGGEDEQAYDDAASLCSDIANGLAFYAGKSPECLGIVDGCMSDCYDAHYGISDDDISQTTESVCWRDGFNGNCDSFARDHGACGGFLVAGSARECVEHCESTSGAHTDDLDGICDSDSYCDDYCDVDLAAAALACGGLTEANRACLTEWIDSNETWICENALERSLEGQE